MTIDTSLIHEALETLKNSPWYNSYRIVQCECGYFYPSATSSCPNFGAMMEEDGKE